MALSSARDTHLQEALEAAEARFYATFELAPVGMMHTAPDGRYLRVNQRVCDLVGYTREELEGRRVQDLTHPDDVQVSLERMVMLLTGEVGAVSTRKRYVHREGHSVWVDVHVSMVREAATGAPLFYVGVVEAAAGVACDTGTGLLRVLDALPDAAVRVDARMRIAYANPAMERLLALPAEAMVGRTLRELGAPAELADEHEAALREAFAGGEPLVRELGHRSAAGEVRRRATCLVPERGADGTVSSVLALAREAADARGLASVKTVEERYRALVEATSAAVWTATSGGLFDGPQPSWQALTGQTTREIGGIGWLAAVHPEDRKQTLTAWTRAVAERTPYEVEHRVRTPRGEYRWLHARAAPVFGADGRVHEWVGAESDITRRRRAEETVRFQAGLLEAVEQAVVATDLAGRVTYWNSWAESMLGWTAEEAIGRRMAELVPAAALADQADGVLARLQAGQGWAGEMALAARDGRRFAGLATASPIRNEVGGLVGIVHTLNDITPMKEAERALRESDERFRRLAATSPDLILVMDVSRAVPTYLNRAEFLGYTAADLNDTPTMLERVHPDDRARVDAARERLRAGGEEGQVTYRLRRRDGAWEWVENRHAVLDRTPDGRPAHTLSFLTVITARKEEEEALRAREDLLRGVLDRTGASVGVLSPDGTLLVANRRLLQDSGTRAEDVHGLPFEDTPPWSYSARVRGRLRAAIGRAAAGETVRYDETVRARNGFSTIDFMLAPLTGEDGTVTHLIASANDVTARVRAEDALRGDAERLRLAMLAVGGVVREHDLGTGAVSWDHGVADLLGYPEAAAGTDEKWWIERIHPQDVQGVVAGFRSWLRGSQPRWSAEYRFRRGDGTWLRVQDRVAAVRDSNGTASRAIGVIETVEAPSAASSVVRPEAPAAD